ncbi:MAG: ABC-type uncharacterized transport system permease subunit [Alcanivorax sp.]|jgi:ABC-type uncharacterized transport system permease subunit
MKQWRYQRLDISLAVRIHIIVIAFVLKTDMAGHSQFGLALYSAGKNGNMFSAFRLPEKGAATTTTKAPLGIG